MAKFNTAISGRPLASKRPTVIAIGCCSLPVVAATGESENSFTAVRGIALESVTCTVKLKFPAVICPDSTPVAGSNVTVGGSAPAVQVYGLVPPATVSAWLYAVAGNPFSNEAVVMAMAAGAESISILKFLVTVAGGVAESVTVTVNAVVPAVAGVPLTTPVVAFNVRPPGKLPPLTLQVTAPVPPELRNVVEYPAPSNALGREVLPIFSGPGNLNGEPANSVKLPVLSP